jgi:hypothetical protein
MPKRRQRPPGYLCEAEYQEQVKGLLERIYREVVVQWCPFRGEGRGTYAPRVDVAVGPFAINDRYEQLYTQMMLGSRDFIESLIEKHNENVRGIGPADFGEILQFNENARCFLCIEIEESGGRKHCIGNLVNASALGRIGLLIARTGAVLRTFLRQRAYLHFLAQVGKNTFKTKNALVLSEQQFNECLQAVELRPQENGQGHIPFPLPQDILERPTDDPTVFHARPLPRSRRTGRR